DALARDAAQALVDPELLAGVRVERDQRGRVAAEAVEHVMGVDRRKGRRRVRVEPRNFELSDVLLGDLIKRVIVGTVWAGQGLWLSLGFEDIVLGNEYSDTGCHDYGQGQRQCSRTTALGFATLRLSTFENGARLCHR